METRIGWAARSWPKKWGRIDRLATLYAVQPIQHWVAPYRASHIPILMYHSVSEQESGGRHPYFETTTAPQVFAEHMKFLREAGYRTVTLNEAVSQIESGEQVCEPRVVLTFDDGFQDFYTHAFPILEEHQFTATVFLPTRYIAEERCQFKNWHCMTWSEVREMHKRGIKFGSHTVTHRQLRFLEITEVDEEIRYSKETIEDQLGHSVESFCYPFAFPETDRMFQGMLRDLLVAQGYKTGVTTILGTIKVSSDQLFLPRLPVNSWDDLRLLRAKLEGAYDWLYYLQYAAKLAS
jgi:peptidoglycan/xylan/chitin deacetylase (PgdA/CDA1 family)